MARTLQADRKAIVTKKQKKTTRSTLSKVYGRASLNAEVRT